MTPETVRQMTAELANKTPDEIRALADQASVAAVVAASVDHSRWVSECSADLYTGQ